MARSASTGPLPALDLRIQGTEQAVTPVGVVIDCDIAEGIPAVEAPHPDAKALILVRMFGESLGMLAKPLPAAGLAPDDLASVIVGDLGQLLGTRFGECGLSWDGQLPTDGLRPPRTPGFLRGRERALREGPSITATVCTRDRPESLSRLLDSLCPQSYPRMRVLVVDNAPRDDRTRQAVLAAQDRHGVDIDYVIEPRPGLSWARNRAIDVADGDVIAWVDDDERCDPWWAAEIARGFVEVPAAGAVTGMIIPAELVTKSQEWFEGFSGVSRGRGFAPAVFSPATARTQSPLYPLPPFGAGGNMAFRRYVLKELGGFDCALGAGTVTCGGEDSAMLSTLMMHGGTVVYQPSAIVHHYHRREYDTLLRHLEGYGRGLTAYYASMLANRPGGSVGFLRAAGDAVRNHLARRGGRHGDVDLDFPRELLRANRKGALQGWFAYPVARVRASRMRRADWAGA
jgi:glycosyltransferase involved in cell wall biosynthesis